MRRRFLVLWAALAAAVGLFGRPARAEVSGARTVVAIFTDDRLLPASVVLDEALREALDAGAPGGRIDYAAELVDASRFRDERHEIAVRDLLQAKYQGRTVGALVLVGPLAGGFVTKHGLFPGVPAVVCDVPKEEGVLRLPGRKATGVFTSVEARLSGTLDLALRLHPDTAHVTYVGGASPPDRAIEVTARRIFHGYEGRLDFVYLVDGTLGDVERDLGRLPPRSVVILGGFGRDPRDVVGTLSRVATAPVYGFVDTFVGAGAVGGALTPGARTGQRAGEAVLRILAGEEASHVPPLVEAVTPTVDARQLERWHVDRALLPEGTVVLFDTPSAWERYRWQILGAAALVVVEAALILALLVQLRRQRRGPFSDPRSAEPAPPARSSPGQRSPPEPP